MSGPDANLDTHGAVIRVIGGGEPTAEQLAALAVALTPAAVGDAEGEAGADMAYAGRPPWLRAALHENLGRRPFVSADDLRMAPPLFS